VGTEYNVPEQSRSTRQNIASSPASWRAGSILRIAPPTLNFYSRYDRRAIVDFIYNKASGGGFRPIRGNS
jgi:hypothetical protein